MSVVEIVESAVDGDSVSGGETSGSEAATARVSRDDDLISPELLRAAVAGEPQAVAQLLSRIQPQVQRFCRARLGRRETTMGSADDVAQDVCMAVLAVLPDYRFAGVSFRAFVFGIARHKIADAFRAMARNRCDAVEELPERTCAEQGPEQLVLEAERNNRLTDLLGVLGARQVEILTLRIAAGLTAEETADALGSTPGAVRVAQHRALQRLRRELEDRAARRDGVTAPAAPAPASTTAPVEPSAPARLTVRRRRTAVRGISPAPARRVATAPGIPAQRPAPAREQAPVAVAV